MALKASKKETLEPCYKEAICRKLCAFAKQKVS